MLPPPWAVAVAALLRVVDVGFPCQVVRPLHAAPAIERVVRVEQLVEQAPPGSECHFAAVAALRPAVLADCPCQAVRPLLSAAVTAPPVAVQRLSVQ